ncbi:unnamed protein product, partial [marine sediment metagenome]
AKAKAKLLETAAKVKEKLKPKEPTFKLKEDIKVAPGTIDPRKTGAGGKTIEETKKEIRKEQADKKKRKKRDKDRKITPSETKELALVVEGKTKEAEILKEERIEKEKAAEVERQKTERIKEDFKSRGFSTYITPTEEEQYDGWIKSGDLIFKNGRVILSNKINFAKNREIILRHSKIGMERFRGIGTTLPVVTPPISVPLQETIKITPPTSVEVAREKLLSQIPEVKSQEKRFEEVFGKDVAEKIKQDVA